MCDTRFKPQVFESLYAELIQYSPGTRRTTVEESRISLKEKLSHRKKENEADIILQALEENQFNKGKAAEILGISRTTLWKKIRELELK